LDQNEVQPLPLVSLLRQEIRRYRQGETETSVGTDLPEPAVAAQSTKSNVDLMNLVVAGLA
jgi:hypothetical protein